MRKAVSPVIMTHRAKPMARTTFMLDRMRTPRSTPVVAETVAMITDSTIRPICAPMPCGMPKRMSRATLSWTTPTPSEAAIPKTPPTSAAVSTTSPAQPSTRSPSSGRRVERTASASRRR